MTEQKKKTIGDFIKKRKHLVWWVKDHETLDAEAIVEAVLNYGDWDDVQTLMRILGMKKVAAIFYKKSKPSKFGRQNYRPEIRNYFMLYFNAHAQRNSHRRTKQTPAAAKKFP